MIKPQVDASILTLIVAYFLGNFPQVVTVTGGLLAIAWFLLRFYDRIKYGPEIKD